jgi:hypothetical protein
VGRRHGDPVLARDIGNAGGLCRGDKRNRRHVSCDTCLRPCRGVREYDPTVSAAENLL